MITLKQVNKAIKEKEINAELVKGEGYFYFVGDDIDNCFATSVYVYRLNALDMDSWMQELDYLVNESKGK